MAIVALGMLRRWLREPLGRFLVLGAALLAVDHAVGRESFGPEEEALQIVVSASREARLVEAFRAEHGRAPSSEETRALLDRWIEEEVLYREALALGLDRSDTVVRRQLTQKMRFLIEDATLLPEPSQADLQAWLDQHAERYGRGPSVDFEHVFSSRGRHGERLEAEAERLAHELQRAPGSFAGLGDPFPVGQVVKGADRARLRRDFGPEFAEALAGQSEGVWSGPVASAFGLHLVRVTARSPFVPAELVDVLHLVRRDFDLARREQQNRAVVAELRGRYRVTSEDTAR
jgi:peptidyl-prolyl cis-trans isomerase C